MFRESFILFWEDEQRVMRIILHFRGIKRLAQNCKEDWEINSTMSTLDDFRVMPFEKKCDVITFQGSYLLQRSLGDCKVFLYSFEGFYIEVFYSPKFQKVLMINAFDKPIGLTPYLDMISLEDLVAKPTI